MFKYVFAAFVCFAISFPATASAQQYGVRQGPVKKLIIGLDKIKCQLGINPAKHCPKGYGTATAPQRVRTNSYNYSSPSYSYATPSTGYSYATPTTAQGSYGFTTQPGITQPGITQSGIQSGITQSGFTTQSSQIIQSTPTTATSGINASPVAAPRMTAPVRIEAAPIVESPISSSGSIFQATGK